MYFLKLFTVSVFLIINSNNVFSAGSSSDSNNAKTKSLAYLSAEKLINKKQYSDAIVKLNDALVTDNKNADIYANDLVLALFESELDPAEKTLLEFIIKKADIVNNFKKYILFLFKK